MASEATAALRFASPVSMWSAPAADCLKSSSSSGFVLKKVCVETPRKCRPQQQEHGLRHALPQSDPNKELAFHGFVNLFSVSGMKKLRHMSVLRNAQRRNQRSFSGFSDWLISTAARSLVRAEATSSSPSSIITEARVAVGEEPARGSATHTVTVVDRQRGITHKFDVPEDRYILHTGEDQGKELPFSCRHGCCTACAVRVKSGQLYQPEALGISAELKEQGYALLCVGYALSDLEVETQDEDEVYWLQFGRYFARGPVERDDYALELAMADE